MVYPSSLVIISSNGIHEPCPISFFLLDLLSFLSNGFAHCLSGLMSEASWHLPWELSAERCITCLFFEITLLLLIMVQRWYCYSFGVVFIAYTEFTLVLGIDEVFLHFFTCWCPAIELLTLCWTISLSIFLLNHWCVFEAIEAIKVTLFIFIFILFIDGNDWLDGHCAESVLTCVWLEQGTLSWWAYFCLHSCLTFKACATPSSCSR